MTTTTCPFSGLGHSPARLGEGCAGCDEAHAKATARKPEPEPNASDIALRAISHALRRAGRDPDFGYHVLATETLELLCAAHDALTGRASGTALGEVWTASAGGAEARCAQDRSRADDFGLLLYALGLRIEDSVGVSSDELAEKIREKVRVLGGRGGGPYTCTCRSDRTREQS